jgi:hypothetical protein
MTSELFIGHRVQPTQAASSRKLTASYERPSSSSRLVSFHRGVELEPLSDDQDISQPPHSSLDLFDLRQDVMQYTNPLRAKVLLFSLLYRTFHTECVEETLLLKSHRLDQLLEDTLCRYPRYEQLAAHLRQTARKLDDPVEYDQVSCAILRSVKSYYSRQQSS